MKKHLDFKAHSIRLLVMVMMCLPAWGSSMLAQVAESYVVYDDESATLTFMHDAFKPADAYPLNVGREDPEWEDVDGSVNKVVFDASFADARPTSCFAWFCDCSSLTEIEGLAYLNTELSPI